MSYKQVSRTHPKRANRLNDTQLVRLVEQYKSGATVYELASEFAIDRRTVSNHLKQQGVIMRLQPLTEETVDEIVRLYDSGLSMSKVGQQISFSADSVSSHLRKRGVKTRDPRGPISLGDENIAHGLSTTTAPQALHELPASGLRHRTLLIVSNCIGPIAKL